VKHTYFVILLFYIFRDIMSGVSSKKRKISEENRLFQDIWEEQYFEVQNEKVQLFV